MDLKPNDDTATADFKADWDKNDDEYDDSQLVFFVLFCKAAVNLKKQLSGCIWVFGSSVIKTMPNMDSDSICKILSVEQI